jgi:hypothetical protein
VTSASHRFNIKVPFPLGRPRGRPVRSSGGTIQGVGFIKDNIQFPSIRSNPIVDLIKRGIPIELLHLLEEFRGSDLGRGQCLLVNQAQKLTQKRQQGAAMQEGSLRGVSHPGTPLNPEPTLIELSNRGVSHHWRIEADLGIERNNTVVRSYGQAFGELQQYGSFVLGGNLAELVQSLAGVVKKDPDSSRVFLLQGLEYNLLQREQAGNVLLVDATELGPRGIRRLRNCLLVRFVQHRAEPQPLAIGHPLEGESESRAVCLTPDKTPNQEFLVWLARSQSQVADFAGANCPEVLSGLTDLPLAVDAHLRHGGQFLFSGLVSAIDSTIPAFLEQEKGAKTENATS